MTKAEIIRKNNAKARRYKKPAIIGLTFSEILTKLNDIVAECDEVVHWQDGEEETLVDALEGEYDEAERFRTDFAVLSSDADRMLEDLYSVSEPERFDDILVAAGLGKSSDPDYGLYGYDDVEEDYFGLEPYDIKWSESESVTRLMRLTKKELIEQMAQSVAIAFSFLGIQARYADLKAAIDLLRAQNKEYLDSLREIEKIYSSIDWTSYRPEYSAAAQKIDQISERLPKEAFLY